jgi:hypothetical protein
LRGGLKEIGGKLSYIQGVREWLGINFRVNEKCGLKTKKIKINVPTLAYPYFFEILRFNNGLKKKFKRVKLNFFKFKTNAILGRPLN